MFTSKPQSIAITALLHLPHLCPQQHPTRAKLRLCLSLLLFQLYISPNQGQFLFVLTLFEASYLMSLCIGCVMRIDGPCCATFGPIFLKAEDVARLLNNLRQPKPHFSVFYATGFFHFCSFFWSNIRLQPKTCAITNVSKLNVITMPTNDFPNLSQFSKTS